MSRYRVTIPVEFVVEIDEGNETVDGPPTLQGDAPLVAVRRALWVLFRQDIARLNEGMFQQILDAKRPLGVTRTIVRGPEHDIPVAELTPVK